MIKIVTDSIVSLSPEEIAQYDITVVPLTIQFGDTVYEDGVTISREEFIDLLATHDTLPTTSQPAIGKFKDVYDQLYEADNDVEIISIHVSTGLSGTVHAAAQAGELTHANVHTFDTLSADRGIAFHVLVAAKMAQAGASVAEIMAELENVRAQTHVSLTFTSLKNMVAGGRISKTAGLIGSLLNIKVGAIMDETGHVVVAAKGRGMKTIAKFHDDIIAEMQSKNEVIAIGLAHVGIPEVAAKLEARLAELFPNAQIHTALVTPAIATHAGLGSIATIYYAK